MTATLRQRVELVGNRCMTLNEAIEKLCELAREHGSDALLMCQSWPVSEFRVYEDDPEDEEAACAPKIVDVILDQRVPAAPATFPSERWEQPK